MTVTLPRHHLVADAVELARIWCEGHSIGGRPALGHAMRVARTLCRHVSEPSVEAVAAALLHDGPGFAPDPAEVDAILTARFGPTVTHIVRTLEREDAIAATTAMMDADLWALQVSAADKIVAIASVLQRAARADDPAAFWHDRTPFVQGLPSLRAFTSRAAPHLPSAMTAELTSLIDHSDSAHQGFAAPAAADDTARR